MHRAFFDDDDDDDGVLCLFCFGCLFKSHPMSCLIQSNCFFFRWPQIKQAVWKKFNGRLVMRNYWFDANWINKKDWRRKKLGVVGRSQIMKTFGVYLNYIHRFGTGTYYDCYLAWATNCRCYLLCTFGECVEKVAHIHELYNFR